LPGKVFSPFRFYLGFQQFCALSLVKAFSRRIHFFEDRMNFLAVFFSHVAAVVC